MTADEDCKENHSSPGEEKKEEAKSNSDEGLCRESSSLSRSRRQMQLRRLGSSRRLIQTTRENAGELFSSPLRSPSLFRSPSGRSSVLTADASKTGERFFLMVTGSIESAVSPSFFASDELYCTYAYQFGNEVSISIMRVC